MTNNVEETSLVIDTDGVSDDLRAISLALQTKNVKVLALSCVVGCVRVEQCVANVARMLRANNTTNVPIYKGAAAPLIGNNHSHSDESHFFGNDGISDTPAEYPKAEKEDFNAFVKNKHAAIALSEIFTDNSGVTMVCIGPLTNVALAIKMNPNFAKLPKRMVVMGGNVHGIGNVRSSSTAECNFGVDPEAAHIVLKEMQCPITIVPWEAFLHESKRTDFDFHAHLNIDVPLAGFFKMITRIGRKELEKHHRQFSFCDEIAVGAAIAPEQVIRESMMLRASVELHGEYTRGQCAVDWTETLWSEEENHKLCLKRRPINFVIKYDVGKLNEMIVNAINNSAAGNCVSGTH